MTHDPITPEELRNEDMQYVLKELLASVQPVLEQDLNWANNPEQLTKEAEQRPPSCDEEIELANRIFNKFWTEPVAQRILPAEARELLGPVDRWRWCLLHIRCCIIFGWLVCRGPRTFRLFAYYVYRYWLCVRQALGSAPVDRPPNEEERKDLNTLFRALASAYKPYLADQLATVQFTSGLAEEAFSGKLDCEEGAEEADAVFERFLTTDVAPALLGREAFEAHRQEPFFWFCRCWCLCAIRFGCCLARARTLLDLIRCLVYYFRCLRECFRPIHCEVTAPSNCAEEEPNLPGLAPEAVGLEIVGSASGGFFSHYTLEYRLVEGAEPCQGEGWLSDEKIVYPGGGSTGTVAVNAGTLGWLDTTFLSTGTYEVRVCVFSSAANVPSTCCCRIFVLFKKMVWIARVADLPGAPVATPPGPFLGTTPIVSGNPAPPGVVVPVGGSISVRGAAFVGECGNRKIKCFDLRAAVGWHPGPEDVGFAATVPLYTIPMLAAPICYDDVDEAKKRAQWNRRDDLESMLTVIWEKKTIGSLQLWKLKDNPFHSHVGLPLGLSAGSPLCPDPHHRCRSGKYTILLEVQDTFGNFYYDTQRVWFDNKPMLTGTHVSFRAIEGLPGCTDLHLEAENSPFVPNGAPCGVPWSVNLLGIAYDEYVDETDLSYPSDNFDFYTLYITRQGGPQWNVPITVSPDPGNPTHGLLRRGQPGVRCEPLPAGGTGCPPAQVVPPQSVDVLTALDMRAFDATCVGSILPASLRPPAGFALKRGTCCGYTFQLFAQDKTWSNGWAGGFHRAWSLPWAVCICNDLPADDNG